MKKKQNSQGGEDQQHSRLLKDDTIIVDDEVYRSELPGGCEEAYGWYVTKGPHRKR